MLVADRLASDLKLAMVKTSGGGPAPGPFDLVLKPLSRPDLGEIRIDDTVFAIGRSEKPFASYGNDVLNMLSRRHARIFREDGVVYLADVGSRNGTTVNRIGYGQTPCPLSDGDEICFGGGLSYRVQLKPRATTSPPEGTLTLTLTPQAPDSGLDTIVIAKFPFLVSKSDANFSRYKKKGEHGREVGYLSRRHAYIYRTGDQAFIEDLDSGNGTFVDGQRLQEHSVPLHDGAVIGFGGGYFVYRVEIRLQAARKPRPEAARTPAVDAVAVPVVAPAPVRAAAAMAAASPAPEVSAPAPEAAPGPAAEAPRAPAAAPVPPPVAEAPPPAPRQPVAAKPAPVVVESDKTQFLAAPTSFLQIFCAADESKADAVADEPATPAAGVAPAGKGAGARPSPAAAAAAAAAAEATPAPRRRPRNRALLLLSEVAALASGSESDSPRRPWWKLAAAAAVLAAVALVVYSWTASERDLKAALAGGDYAKAAALAGRLLESNPDDVDLKARATEAALKAYVPQWLDKVRAHDFDGAGGVLKGMAGLESHDADLRHLADELDWLGSLERLVASRGGPDAPIRIYADEDGVERLVGRWNDDTGEHQRALVRIASYVPQFGDWYGEALSHLRKLQSDATVDLPVIERLKASIAGDLGRDAPEALEAELRDAAARYPGIGGLDAVRQDLARYLEIRREARARKSGRLFALLHGARFSTPPFGQSLRTLTANGQLPSADLLAQYDAATRSWKDGKAADAFAALQRMMSAGSWGEAAAGELERRQQIASRFVALQQSRGSGGYVDALLAFRSSLDADEDAYFLHATDADLAQQKDQVIAKARDALARARGLWQEYRSLGAIDAPLRTESAMSSAFRDRARLLAGASDAARRGSRIYAQVDASGAAQWTPMKDEIDAEAGLQRRKLHDLGNVVDPGLLKAKLALLGESAPSGDPAE